MGKRRYEGEQTRGEILAKARELFGQKGYAGTSMGDICKATGRSIGNIYYYFKSKEELFLCMTEETLAEWWREAEEVLARCESAIEKLYAYSDYVASIEGPPISVEREFFSIVGVDSEGGRRLAGILNKGFEKTKKFIAGGIARGEFKDMDLFELTFIVSVIYMGLNRYCATMQPEYRKGLMRKATAMLLEGIGTGKREPPPSQAGCRRNLEKGGAVAGVRTA